MPSLSTTPHAPTARPHPALPAPNPPRHRNPPTTPPDLQRSKVRQHHHQPGSPQTRTTPLHPDPDNRHYHPAPHQHPTTTAPPTSHQRPHYRPQSPAKSRSPADPRARSPQPRRPNHRHDPTHAHYSHQTNPSLQHQDQPRPDRGPHRKQTIPRYSTPSPPHHPTTIPQPPANPMRTRRPDQAPTRPDHQSGRWPYHRPDLYSQAPRRAELPTADPAPAPAPAPAKPYRSHDHRP